jgi:hypothetical protein
MEKESSGVVGESADAIRMPDLATAEWVPRLSDPPEAVSILPNCHTLLLWCKAYPRPSRAVSLNYFLGASLRHRPPLLLPVDRDELRV